MGLDDSGGGGLKARIRVFRLTPQASASDDSYATASGAGRLYEVEGSQLSSRPRLSRAAVSSSSLLPRPPISKALAALARTEEPSLPLLLVFGRWLSSGFAVPAVANPSLAVRLGMNRSPVLCGTRTVVLPDRVRVEGSLRVVVRSLDEGDCEDDGPVPVKVHSETPNSRCLGDFRVRAMLDLGDSR